MSGVANPHRRDVQFAEGQKVWLSSAHLPLRVGARKLASRWAGPFTVETRIGQQAYRLALPSKWKLHPVFHTSQLKAVTGEVHGEQPVPLEQEGAAVEYEVERVLAVRKLRGSTEYLVRWKGYGSWEDSWEPEENLTNAKQAVEAFRKSRGSRDRR